MNKDLHGIDQKEKNERSCDQSSKTSEIKSKNLLDNKNESQNMNMLEIMDKILTCLKSEEKDIFIKIFENILNVAELEVDKRKITQKLICSFLNNLEECEPIDLDFVSQKFKSTIVPKNFRQLMVENSKLTELHVIGAGAFGVVRFGYLHKNNISASVAIKQPKSHDEFDVLENEAKVMCELDHPNILKLLAIQKTPFRIVVEYMPLGNITDAIAEKHFSDGELLKVLQDVATGMEYLVEKKFVHRDLLCRNIFVDDSANRLVCKVGDFGTCCYVGDTNGVYEEKEHTFFQVGLPPEAVRTQQFSTKTDVYTMGVLIWELYMAAGYQTPEIPFIPFLPPFLMGGINFILKLFAETGHLVKPRRINDGLFNFVKSKMLNKHPERRPTFTEVKEQVIQLINK